MKGQAIMQYRHPMHLSDCQMTGPFSVFFMAFVRHAAAQAGQRAALDHALVARQLLARAIGRPGGSVRAHPNITLWTMSEVTKVDGSVGNFTVTVRRRPRYIKADLCVGCLECIKSCVFKEGKFTDEFNVGLSKRKPVYIPFPQALPNAPVIDRIEVVRTGKVRRAKLYYLRSLRGKAARLKERN